MKEMKRTAMILMCLGAMLTTTAQELIESPIVSEKDYVWYVKQKEAWKEETQKNPQNEKAWQNSTTAMPDGYRASSTVSWVATTNWLPTIPTTPFCASTMPVANTVRITLSRHGSFPLPATSARTAIVICR